MTSAEILTALESERTHLQTECAKAQIRLGQLDTAIAALKGETVPATNGTPKTERGPSVADMVEKAARAIGAGAVVDHESLKIKATTLFPEHGAKIKTGVYCAVASLLKRNVLQRTPGGFKLQ